MTHQNIKKPWLNDVAVLSIFFARPDVFKKSFDRIREARPRVLLLWQDGPRPNRPDDVENIKKCREIASQIDWECEVHTNFHEENMGCDPSTHYSHKWAFSIVDKCIILEDDIVPSLSFFPFCKELLDKYENDPRVDRICGMNILDQYKCDGDYFFATYGNSWGWATWKRTADKWETDYSFLDDNYAMKMLEIINSRDGGGYSIIERCERERKEGIPYWEMVTGIEGILNSSLVLYPSKNLINNIGIDVNSTHAPSNINQISETAKMVFHMQTYEYSFPLKHPKYLFSDPLFPIECRKLFAISKKEKIGYYLKKLTLKNICRKLNLNNREENNKFQISH